MNNGNSAIKATSQEIILKDRKDLTITGVKKVNTLNPTCFDVETILGRMKIDGKDLEMISMDIEDGILLITGSIHQVSYLDNVKRRKESSFIAKLFK